MFTFQSSNIETLKRVSDAVVNELDPMFHPTDTMLSIVKRFRMVPINLGTQRLERRVCMLCQKGTRKAYEMKCAHSFHMKCIHNWILHNDFNCPVCKKCMIYQCFG